MAKETLKNERIFHTSDAVRWQTDRMKLFAWENGIIEHLNERLDYLRTYGGGDETQFQTRVSPDFPGNDLNLIFTIVRWNTTLLSFVHFMTIGLIWHESSKEWGCHS